MVWGDRSRGGSGTAAGKNPKPVGAEAAPSQSFTSTPGPVGHNDDSNPDQARKKRIEKLLQQYRAMISDARTQGKVVAADNLEHWLSGSGTAKELGSGWLRTFPSVLYAETVNHVRFEEKLSGTALEMKVGEQRDLQDYWDKKLTASVFKELYYASGTSTLTSRGLFTLKREGDVVTIKGTVEHHWWDPYDWHANLGAWIPGHGTISDSDALELEKAGHGKPFGMYGFWHRTLTGTYGIDTGFAWRDEPKYTWGAVQAGRAPSGSAGVWAKGHKAVTDSTRVVLPGL